MSKQGLLQDADEFKKYLEMDQRCATSLQFLTPSKPLVSHCICTRVPPSPQTIVKYHLLYHPPHLLR